MCVNVSIDNLGEHNRMWKSTGNMVSKMGLNEQRFEGFCFVKCLTGKTLLKILRFFWSRIKDFSAERGLGSFLAEIRR